MTKKDLVSELSEKMKCTKVEATAFLDAFEAIVSQGYKDENAIPFGDVGSFKVKHIKERTARNPRNGETVNVPAKKKLVLVPGISFR